jgi:hypothetical protein
MLPSTTHKMGCPGRLWIRYEIISALLPGEIASD